MKKLVLFLAILVLVPLFRAQAYVEVAFFEMKDKNGHTMAFEEGGRFFHVAISHKGLWLHADPYYGVQLVDEGALAGFGERVVVAISDLPEPSDTEVKRVLGTKFDPTYSWELPGTTYCSKLVGQLLGLAPTPLEFKGSQLSHHQERRQRGEVGLSPDDIFQAIQRRGSRTFGANIRCEKLFR